MSPPCWDHQKQRHRRCRSHRHRQLSLLPAMLIVLLVLLQSFELHMCRQLMRRSDPAAAPTPRHLQDAPDKRTAAEPIVSQPEEIFSAPNDAADTSYDEYPMVVPKRAALLLDRLMVALHHALENEREGHRIGDFYANKNMMQIKPTEYKHAHEQPAEDGSNPPANSQNFNMYSDDDPGVSLDYDFKDLNQINRATGETLMAKSFQRRAGGIGGGVNTAGDAAGGDAATMAMATGAGGVGVGAGRRINHGANGGGRMYWRCYFNAVSCF